MIEEQREHGKGEAPRPPPSGGGPARGGAGDGGAAGASSGHTGTAEKPAANAVEGTQLSSTRRLWGRLSGRPSDAN